MYGYFLSSTHSNGGDRSQENRKTQNYLLQKHNADWLAGDDVISILIADWLMNYDAISIFNADWLTSDDDVWKSNADWLI